MLYIINEAESFGAYAAMFDGSCVLHEALRGYCP